MTTYHVAVDVGGTFTDVVTMDDNGNLAVGKVPSTAQPVDGVLYGLERLGVPLDQAAFFSHGTTVATNALITRELPPTAMVTTRGFRDVIEIRRGTKDDLWDTYKDVAPPYVRRRDRLVVSERVSAEGEIIKAVAADDVEAIAASIRQRGYTAVAICFINSYANPANELEAKRLLAAALPEVMISTSSEVLPELFEHERFSTTVVNASLGPLVAGYLTSLEDELHARQYGGDLLVLHSGGGVMTPAAASHLAGRIAGSGIAAGAIAARHIASACGFANAIGVDMGGTSTDVSVTHQGDLRVTKDWYIEYGYPICFPSVEVLTIGAGGGSIAWIDEAGSLRNGPRSAGSDPGPAAYGLDGREATNTDANLVLGRLGENLIGGEMTLSKNLAEEALMASVGRRLGLGPIEAASATIDVANANMADAVRITSIRRGHDPRDFVLVAFGGAGPLHGAALARDLAIPTVVVPPHPGITSALGCLLVDIRHDLSSMFLSMLDVADTEDIEAEFSALEATARVRLEAENVSPEDMRFSRTIDMRYHGQWRSIAVPVHHPVEPSATLAERFHALHEREHTFRRHDGAIEMYRLNLTAVGITQKAELRAHDGPAGSPRVRAERGVYFDEAGGTVQTPIYDRGDLTVGFEIVGPAVFEQLDSTTVVPPDVRATVDEWLNVRLEIGA